MDPLRTTARLIYPLYTVDQGSFFLSELRLQNNNGGELHTQFQQINSIMFHRLNIYNILLSTFDIIVVYTV